MAASSNSDNNSAHPVWRRRGNRLLLLIVLVLVPWFLFQLVRNLDWADVTRAIGSFSNLNLSLGLVAAVASYCVYASFDLLGRHYTGHQLPSSQVLPVTFVCYAFNLNLGAWIGGVALRYRLYSRLGLDVATITRILSFSLITNWLGYVLLAGILFSLRLIRLPDAWKLSTTGLQWLGFALLLTGLGYLLACGYSRRRTWNLRGHEITLPTGPVALTQAVLGVVNWLLMAAVIFLLLPDHAYYPLVVSVLLIGSIAGAISHIPAGLGVLETVFIALLQHQFSQGTLVAVLIGYRALYFLFPLAIASVVYLLLENNAKALTHQSAN
ncbi:MAG: lysylphosphatidylglycerol synthase domain-containing protein [Pseudomonadota bacterium]